ncbi:MAG: hypothetical protein R6V49_07195 [Bacteroidales bacterium]
MKKMLTFFVAMLLLASTANAQLTSKKGIPVLPQAGDFALGVNALPMLEYLGNAMNGNTWNSTHWDFVNGNQSIFGKYFLTDLTALRVGLRIGLTSLTEGVYVKDDFDATGEDQVLDKYTNKETNIYLSIGMEKRKGIYRMQGFYGAEAMLGVMSESDSYVYGNEITSTNPMPTTHDFGYNIPMAGARVLNAKDGFGFMFGARLFVGAEYFIFPKLSLGGEFGWGLGIMSRGDSKGTVEYWNIADAKVDEMERLGGNGSGFSLDTDNYGGIIKILFHF